MECKFVAGQDVVCIWPGPWWSADSDLKGVSHPQLGLVYQVMEVYASDKDGLVYIRLNGFPLDHAYEANCFRRVSKTDISWAHEILRRATTKELV